jgi:hypothetical protein
LVHLVLAAVPIAALVLVVVAALWAAAGRRLGVITPIIALGALLTVSVRTHAGQRLEARVRITPLIRKHIALGKEVLPWMIGLFVIPLLVAVGAHRFRSSARTLGRIVVGVLAVAISVGAVQQGVRTGEAGSRAVWTGNFSDQAVKQRMDARPAENPAADSYL